MIQRLHAYRKHLRSAIARNRSAAGGLVDRPAPRSAPPLARHTDIGADRRWSLRCVVLRCMAISLACGSVSVTAADARPADQAAIVLEADVLRLRGRYVEALDRYASLPESEPQRWWGSLLIHEEQGRIDEARVAADQGWQATAAPRFAVWRARESLDRGDLAEAAEQLQAAEPLAADDPQLRLVRSLLRIEEYQDDESLHALEQLAELRRAGTADWSLDQQLAFGEAGLWLAELQGRGDELQSLRRDWWPKVLAAYPQAWQAHAALAELAWRQHNGAEAAEAIDRGLALNPFSARLLALRGELALDDYRLERAAADAELALQRCPQYHWAERILIDVAVASGDLTEARQTLAAALQHRPRDPELLGRAIALHALGAGDPLPGEAARFVVDPQGNQDTSSFIASRVYHAEGECLLRMRRLPLAADAFRRGHKVAPQDSELAGDLALVLAHLGDAREVRPLLEQALAGDPANLRARNMREVLQTLERYESRSQDQVTMRFDPALRKEWIALLMEEIHQHAWPRVTKMFGHEPQAGALIEMFRRADGVSGHAWFSARMTALPFVDTVAACTGSAVACTAPEELPTPLHWGDTLRHELVHVVHLSQTQHGVPHWLTEGLAVLVEDRPRTAQWQQLLARALLTDQIFDPHTINAGFIRPRRPTDRPTAYAQAEWYMEFIQEQFGADAWLQMLEACRDGADPARPLTALKIRPEAFQQRFLAWAWPQVALWPWALSAEESRAAVGFLKSQSDAFPDSPDLACLLLSARRAAGERGWDDSLEELLKRFPEHGGIVSLRAASLSANGDEKLAVELLDAASDRGALSDDGWRLWVSKEQAAGSRERTSAALDRASQHATEPVFFLKPLAALQLQTDDLSLVDTLERLSNHLADAPIYPRKLLALAIERGDDAAAHRWAREILLRAPDDELAWQTYLQPVP